MSGYLQRLAISAARPDRRVQPLVGGLFARQPEQAIEEVITTIDSPAASSAISRPIAVKDRRTGTGIRSDEQRIEESAVRQVQDEAPASMFTEQVRRGSEKPRHRSLPDLVEQDSVFVSERKERVERAGLPAHRMERPATPDLLVTAAKSIEQSADSQPGIPDKMQTLIGEISQMDPAQAGEPLRAMLLKAASADPARTMIRAPATQPQAPPPARAGSDDIQIHIGRIEVIAVPPPASRPVSAPVRRGPTLEEYLQQRDRRSR